MEDESSDFEENDDENDDESKEIDEWYNDLEDWEEEDE